MNKFELPFKLAPAFKDYIWGGERLKADYGKRTDLPKVAESWELSSHEDGSSLIVSENSEINGMAFSEYLKEKGENPAEFPILIKLIDAASSLSVQVHPDDEYAQRHEGSAGKTEMWYILEAEEGSFLYVGFDREISLVEFKERIENGTLTEVLGKMYVKKGDCVFIPAGTIHAINGGIVLAEVQQNSNITYRVFDYGRKGADGKERPLHIEKALAVTDRTVFASDRYFTSEDDEEERVLADCEYFTAYRIRLNGRLEMQQSEDGFLSLTCISGAFAVLMGEIRIEASLGETVFVPAGAESYALEGEAAVLAAASALRD